MATPFPDLTLSPTGRLVPAAADEEGKGARTGGASDEGELSPALRAALAALERGTGAFVLELGARAPEAALPPAVAFWRDLGRDLVTRLCRREDLATRAGEIELELDEEEITRRLAGAPPMPGGEYLSRALLGRLWDDALAAFRLSLLDSGEGPQGWLAARSPAWSLVGRVHLHLAERKRDEEFPFAFLATYAEGISTAGRPRHVPLGRALSLYAHGRDPEALRSLLAPLRRAADESELVAELLDSGDVFHPLAWDPDQAYAFLRELPVLERSGVLVKVPDWWSRRSRPRVRVSVGDQPPSRLGMEALLSFSVDMALDGEPLTDAERARLLEGSAGLVLIRGRWVEADPEKLREVMDRWDQLADAAGEGLGFGEAMRLLAGAAVTGDDPEEDEEEAAWSERVAGPWLREALEGLRRQDRQLPTRLRRGVRAELRGYQVEGVRWLAGLASLGLGACLADDMGLGKTLQALALLTLRRRSHPGPSLVVVPASLLANWEAEAARFTPDLSVLVAHPSSTPRDELRSLVSEELAAYDLVLTSYGYLARLPSLQEVEWSALVLDEAQAVKNPSTRAAQTVRKLTAECRLALTGTPIENRLGDLWSLFRVLNPGLLGNRRQFQEFHKRLARRQQDRYGPLRRLIRPYILRRLKTDPEVAPELPDKTELVARCPLTRVQATLYEDSVRELAEKVRTLDGMERRGLVLATLTRLQQICNHPSQWLGDGAYDAEQSGKMRRLAALAEEISARQEKLLVFTRFRELTEPLAHFLGGVFGREGLVLHGGTPVRKRGPMVERFQDEAGPPFFVLSLKAGGTGLNLTAASHVVHFDRWWNPAVERQATDRAYRIGQHRNVLVHKLVCPGTLEERIDQLLRDKQQLAEDLLGEAGGERALTELGDEELMELVSLDLQAARLDA